MMFSTTAVELIWAYLETKKPERVRILWNRLFSSAGKILSEDFWRYTLPVLAASLVWGIAYVLYSVIMGHMGSDAVAANSITSIAKSLLSCLIRGVSGGAGVLIGNLLGADELEKAREYGGRLTHLAIAIGVVTGGLLMLISPAIVHFAPLTDTAAEYLQYMLLFCGLNLMAQSVNTTVLDGIFCAGGDAKFDMQGNIGAMWCFSVPLGFLAAFWLKLPVMVVYCIVNLGEMRASTNPLAYCEGGFYGGHLKPSDKIRPLLKPMTASFGITALNELQELYNGKSLVEDGQFALDTLKYINDKVAEFKKEDGILYAIYGTPAESLCGLQIEQFRKQYGIVRNVSDRPYVSNSFHCHVTEDITPIQKQDLEGRFWELCNGGKIQYVRYPVGYNKGAIKTLIERAMELGYYEGVNLSLAYCDDCGHQELDMDVCPVCGSKNLTKIDRMNGYLSYSRVHGDTRLNEAKMAEIAERKSM